MSFTFSNNFDPNKHVHITLGIPVDPKFLEIIKEKGYAVFGPTGAILAFNSTGKIAYHLFKKNEPFYARKVDDYRIDMT